MRENSEHDDMVVMELVVLRQGFAKRYTGGGGVGEGKGLRQGKGLVILAALPPPLFIGEGERGPAPSDPI